MRSLHGMDHLGKKPTLQRIAEEFYWPTLKRDVEFFYKCCVPCKKVKPGRKLMGSGEFKVPDRRFSRVMVDIVGPLPPSYGYKFLLTAICRSSRFLQAIPLQEATSSAAAAAFLHHWVALMGVPSMVTSDNGASFTANLWKDMLAKLNIEVRYSALYRPQSIGLLERQHRPLKDGLKAAIEDMTEKHQDKWLDFLPFILLGRRVALQPDIKASASELTFGMNMRIPGQILYDPGDLPDGPTLHGILSDVRNKTNKTAVQTSNHGAPEKVLPAIPNNVTHVYTRQHKTTGLQCPFEGPFEIVDRPSRSTVKIRVGQYKDGQGRFEVRHLNDLKLAHPDSMASPASRPALGRPAATSASTDSSEATEERTPEIRFPNLPARPPFCKQPVDSPVESDNNSNQDSNVGGKVSVGDSTRASSRPLRSTRNPNPAYVNGMWLGSSPSSPVAASAWSASPEEIRLLNSSINSK